MINSENVHEQLLAENQELLTALTNLLGDMYLVECGELPVKELNLGSRQEAIAVMAAARKRLFTHFGG